jgi:hypothetical protein
MPRRATEITPWRQSASALCWASQESKALIGTCGQRLPDSLTRLVSPNHQPRWIYRFEGIPAGACRAGKFARPDLPFIHSRRRSGCVPAEPYPPLRARPSLTARCARSKSAATDITSECNFGVSAPMARPQKTGAAHRPATAGQAAAVLQFEWIAPGYTARSFWNASRRWIAALEGLSKFRLGPDFDWPDRVPIGV